MPKAELQFQADMTKERVKQLFTAAFSSKYEIVDKAMIIMTDFAIKKSGWTGIAIRYVAKPDAQKAFLEYNAFVPSVGLRFLANGLLPIIILGLTSWKTMTAEVKEFIESNPELKVLSRK
ncbi:MAG: hypothetical protein NT080_08515 [Spirochaetes bacterium]|nr:hypothetical protein [Spirochaetota bacterium]